tara:strand:- start:2794 stop:3039 length:246 start_codon:yes stop_codon:yes gene_type:complete
MKDSFDDAAIRAQQFMAGLHTMQEIVKSVDEHSHALEMIEACSRHKDLAPSIADFEAEIKEIEAFWIKVASIYAAIGQMDS